MKFSFSNGPNTAAARVDPRRSDEPVVGIPAHDDGVAVGGQRDGVALAGVSNRAGADQLAALLGPDSPAAGVDPRRPDVGVVSSNPAHDGGVAIGGQRDGVALLGGSNSAGADQLAALLGPDAAAAGEDPRRPGVCVVVGPPTMAVLPSADSATERPCAAFPTASVPTSLLPCWVQTPPLRVKTHAAPVYELSPGPPTMAVLPSADSATDQPCVGVSNRAGADQLAALLGPDTVAAGEDPRRPGARSCRQARPRSRCCRRRTARRRSLARRVQPRRCRPACCPAGSKPRRCG